MFTASVWEYSWYLYFDFLSWNLAELLKLALIVCMGVCEFLGFSIYNTVSITNRKTFTCSFLVWMMPYIYFSCLIALARTSSNTLTRSSENRHSYLVFDLMEKIFRLLPLSGCYLWVFQMSFIRFSKFLLFVFYSAFLPWIDVGFC